MNDYKVNDVRNVALVGHGAVGKTTVADLLLFQSGVTPRLGSVDDGTSLLDTDEEEINHRISIASTLVHFDHAGHHINLIDTPGYPDFIGQVSGALRAVETALILLNAGHGVEINALRVSRMSQEAGIARMIVFNKCDTENIDYDSLIESVRETFGSHCVPINLPVGLGADFKAVCDLVNYSEPPPAGTLGDPESTRQSLIEAIVESNEGLLERFFEGEELSAAELSANIPKAMAAGTLIPVLFMSAKTGVGVSEFMDAMSNYTLCPQDIQRMEETRDGRSVMIDPSPDQPFVAQVIKTRIDPFISKMSYLRVFSGKLDKDSSVVNVRTGKPVRINQLLDVQGGKQEPVDSVSVGDIFAVAKVDDLQPGDTLTADANGDGLSLPEIKYPHPVVGLAVEPKSQNDQQKISGALHKLEEEDQTFHVVHDEETHEMVMQGMSELHLKIMEEKLLHRDKVEVITHQPKVPYRETIMGTAEGSYRHKKQSGGAGQFAEVHLRVSPMPAEVDPEAYFTKENFDHLRTYHYDPELNFAFVDRISGGSIPNQFIPAVEKGVRERMKQGVISGCQVQDLVCEVFFGKDHPVDSNETAFKIAGSKCFSELFEKARPALMEPIVKIEILIPEECVGDISSDLSSRRGRMEGMQVSQGGYEIIQARVPLAEIMTYARTLSSLTGGRGTYDIELSHYEMIPPNEQSKVIEILNKASE
ncbi:Elongation factor G [Gimesia panareensis]|uniref:Elongation factor G n=1 Tax=Gimesia panareensis TaxID=2527978 RepID=A0A518FNT7_9PLAN|nr:elongation factor G [Gimesia panareensis]QDV18021.1 Elongation factor G [Gimesia panareensis]